MNTNDWFSVVDYFIENSFNYPSLFVSSSALLIAALSAILSFYTFRKQHRESHYVQLAAVWNDILDVERLNSKFFDAAVTEFYYDRMSPDEQLIYDIYCYKVWGHVEDIVVKGFQNDQQFQQVIYWITSYHYEWLRRNPTFFTIETFWDVVEKARAGPRLTFRHKGLPTKNNDIDWDLISSDYHKYILSPFASEMIVVENGKIRNHLIRYLDEIPKEDMEKMAVADFGCGPGNLIPHIAGKIKEIWGIDKSSNSLKIAEEIANKHGIEFHAECVDLLALDLGRKFDMIICVNAVLMAAREQNIEVLKRMREHLSPSGRLVAVLPSYDTVEYLRKLWRDKYVLGFGERHADRIVSAFDLSKKAQ